MTRVLVEDFVHRTGEHCASTALRNVLAHGGVDLSEPMVFGLGGWLGFVSIRNPDASPTAMFHGRATSTQGFFEHTAMPARERIEADDDVAWHEARARLDAGEPVLITTDTFYLAYQNTTSHFPGHRCVLVGYDERENLAWIADRKYEEYKVCSLDELRRARNARDYPFPCQNEWGEFHGPKRLGRRVEDTIPIALRKNAQSMLGGHEDYPCGVAAMRSLALELPAWGDLPDWSWAARFGYQVVVKRGAGGSFFRSIYADFLREAETMLPSLAEAGLSPRMDDIARRWRDLAAVLKEQSEREACAPALFAAAGEMMGELADREAAFYRAALEITGGPTPD